MIVGAGPNLGLAIARRFGREGFSVGLVSRNQEKLDGLAGELEADGITAAGAAADIRDSDGLAAAIRSLADRLGAVDGARGRPHAVGGAADQEGVRTAAAPPGRRGSSPRTRCSSRRSATSSGCI